MDNYYEKNAESYIEETIKCNMEEQYKLFTKYLIPKAKILDIGFGSGRDIEYFISKGYQAEGIDVTKAFVKNMQEKGYTVYLKAAEDLDFINYYDAIWACASLLHVKKDCLNEVMEKCALALKENGIIYCSFKYGDFEGIKNGRYFNYLNEKDINEILKNTNLNLLEMVITNDVREDRKDEKWLNLVLRKENN